MNRIEKLDRVVILLVVSIMLMGVAHSQAAGKSKAGAAFEQLSSLVGEWKGTQEGAVGEVTLTYTLTANDSVLMEESRPAGGPAMITMFSVGGDHLVATHYCSARNQPQMATDPINESRKNVLAFSFVRITGMSTPDDWHNTALEMHLDDRDHLSQVWGWEYQGKKGTAVFHFVRKKACQVQLHETVFPF
jgi:hypothetical protein